MVSHHTEYKKTENNENLPCSGWPSALNNNEKSKLVNEVTKNQHAPLHKIINTLSLDCSLTTAKQALYNAGIHSHVVAKKPFVSERHASAYEKAYDWAQVIFLDQSIVEIEKQSQQMRVWGGVGESLSIEFLEPTFKSGQRSVMVWVLSWEK
ncbi:8554_t:CDS:2 [Diversispora eburnea]|uniref:8554_t:CDS:1 n=1 Tax=Diversispora eburnea TaxID=1213867 RepID=A0A9N8ZW13_9GLOM|nr:8554_t:CDS:2 [Diversispora eburnea]